MSKSHDYSQLVDEYRRLEVNIKTMPAGLLNVVDLLSHRMLLITVSAVRKVEQLWGQKATQGEVNAPV